MFQGPWDFFKARVTTIAAFVVGAREREASPAERRVGRIVDVASNIALLLLLFVLVGKGAVWVWSQAFASGVGDAIVEQIHGPKELLILGFLALVALAVVSAVIELLFHARAVLAPSRLLAAYAVYKVLRLSVRLAFGTSDASTEDVVEAFLE